MLQGPVRLYEGRCVVKERSQINNYLRKRLVFVRALRIFGVTSTVIFVNYSEVL